MQPSPVEEIIQFINDLKPKFSHIKETMLSYFTEIRKHPEIQLDNHLKILFEQVGDVKGTSIHAQLLTHFNRLLDRGAILSKNWDVVEEYFRTLMASDSDLVHLKMVEIILTMIHRMNKPHCLQLSQILKLLTIVSVSPSISAQTIEQCVDRLTEKLVILQRSIDTIDRLELETFIEEVCDRLVEEHTQVEDKLYSERLSIYSVLRVLQRVYNRPEDPKAMEGMTNTNTKVFEAVSQHCWDVQASGPSRLHCIQLLGRLTQHCPQKTSHLISSLLRFSRQHNQSEFAMETLTQLFSGSGFCLFLFNCIPEIAKWTLGVILSVPISDGGESVVSGLLNLLGLLLDYIGKSEGQLDRETQLDEIRNLLVQMRPVMKRLAKMKVGQVTEFWTRLYSRALHYCFLFRIEINSYLSLLRTSRQLFEETLNKYSSYFEEEQYWIIYHILHNKKWEDYFRNATFKRDIHIRALRKLILESEAKGQLEETLFAVKEIAHIAMQSKGDPSLLGEISDSCILVFDRGILECEKVFVEMIAWFLGNNGNIEWFHLLGKAYDLTEDSSLRLEMLQILNRLMTDSGDKFSEDIWLTIILILNESFQSPMVQLLKIVLLMLETIVQQYVYNFTKQSVQQIVECIVNYPIVDNNDAKIKYRICGLMWTLGEVESKEELSTKLILNRLGELCLDEIPQVAINGLCIYSQLGDYVGYQQLALPIMRASKDPVITSYLQNYVKLVRRTLTSQLYQNINEFLVQYLPELLQLNSNELILESTICHRELTNLTVKEIFREPEYYELGLFFYINFLSEQPKELKLVRYSLPKMLIYLLQEMVSLSLHPEFNTSRILPSCLKLVLKIVKYPQLTNTVFNLEKHKIYFEEIQVVDHLHKFYLNLARKQLLTECMRLQPLPRETMIKHATHLAQEQRMDWLIYLGKPLDGKEIKMYADVFNTPEQVDYVERQQDWDLREYLIVQGRIKKRARRSSQFKISELDFTLCQQDDQDSPETKDTKKVILKELLNKVVQTIKEGEESQVLQVLVEVTDLSIHPDSLVNQKKSVYSTKGHLFWLGHHLLELSLRTSSQRIRAQLAKMCQVMNELADQ